MIFEYLPISNKRQIGNNRKLSDIKFIVIHDTANTNKGAGARNHQRYLENAQRHGSAHYYVDDSEIIQPIGDSKVAYSVGDTWANRNRTRTDVTNSNSISVEMCINSDSDYKQMLKNTVELVKNLIDRFNLSVENVVRHYDATGKRCPDTMGRDNWADWKIFKNEINKPIEYKMDLSKTRFEFGKNKIENERSDWAINWDRAVELGIVDGTKPKEPATREQVIEMMFRFWGVMK